MKIVTLGLAIAFFVLSFMVVMGSFNFFNNVSGSVGEDVNTDCIEASFKLENINYENNELSFLLFQENTLSNEIINGINIRSGDSDEINQIKTKELKNGRSEFVKLNISIDDSGLFYASAYGCTSDYEKRCYTTKEKCQ